MSFDLEKTSDKLLLLLLLTDLAFIFIHGVYKMNFLSSPFFSIEKDLGYAEIYQYIKEYWIVLLLFLMALEKRHVIYFSWSILFIYLLFDDAFQIHEIIGYYLIGYLDLQPKFLLRAQDFGELSVSLFFGILLFSFVGVAYFFSSRKAKQISKRLFILVMVLAFFGIIMDMLVIAIPWGKPIMILIEDGGEMLIMSVIVWYLIDLEFTQKEPLSIPENA